MLGQAAIRTEPDEAFVWITLTALEDSPGPSLSDVASRGEKLVALLDALAIARVDRSTSGITVREEFDHTKDGRRTLGHRAAATIAVRVTDTEVIGRVIMRATQELDARIAGPSWRVSEANPAWLQAATRAAANAREKAAAYAAGVDARLGRLIALAEPDDPRFAGHRSMAMAAAAGPGPDMPVDAGEKEVAASIQATFELESG